MEQLDIHCFPGALVPVAVNALYDERIFTIFPHIHSVILFQTSGKKERKIGNLACGNIFMYLADSSVADFSSLRH